MFTGTISVTDLNSQTDPSKRILLDNLPRLIAGYSRTPGIDWIVVVVDTDHRDCRSFLLELQNISAQRSSAGNVLFRPAIEEIESWYFGDRSAILAAYPKAKPAILSRYVQDSICDTWEVLADALHPGGSVALKKSGFPASGDVKHAWAKTIGPKMEPDRNVSPSSGKLRDGLRELVKIFEGKR